MNTLGVTVLLKGSRTFVANDELLLELPVATPWLATAGMAMFFLGLLAH